MRIASWLVPAVAIASTAVAGRADACPGNPDPDARCGLAYEPMHLGHVTHFLDLSYLAGVEAIVATGGTSRVDTGVGLDLAYTAQLGPRERPEYELSASLGATAHRIEGGELAGNGLSTRAGVRLGPAALLLADTVSHHNTVWFPLAFEIAHEGDLAVLPKLSMRPDLMRARYGRERVTLSTQLVRMETSGDDVKEGTAAGPGAREPTSAAFDLLDFDGSLEATFQHGTRLDYTVGGSVFRAVGRIKEGLRMDLLAWDHHAIKLPTGTSTAIDTFWAIRADYVNPTTGTHYFFGWGEIASIPNETRFRELLREKNPPEPGEDKHDELGVGGLGFWFDRSWGTIGLQYRRDPYITINAEPALEDRFFVEATSLPLPGGIRLTGRGYVAQTTRLVNDELVEDTTVGAEVDATARLAGFDVMIKGEVGRSYYAAVDNGAPAIGFAANGSLTISRSGSSQFSR